MPIAEVNKLIEQELVHDMPTIVAMANIQGESIAKVSETESPSAVKAALVSELEEQQRLVVDVALQVQQTHAALQRREKELQSNAHDKLVQLSSKYGETAVKQYLQHAQNQRVIDTLKNRVQALGGSADEAAANVLNSAEKTALALANRKKNIAAMLNKLSLIVDCIEGLKCRTDKFVQGHMTSLQSAIEGQTTTVINRLWKLLVQTQTISSVEALQKKLYIQSNPTLFQNIHDSDWFLNAALSNARMQSLSNLLSQPL